MGNVFTGRLVSRTYRSRCPEVVLSAWPDTGKMKNINIIQTVMLGHRNFCFMSATSGRACMMLNSRHCYCALPLRIEGKSNRTGVQVPLVITFI